jgi:predicted short-subunit dehydrogenase-like oxidoreductase (DUF2520 family)
MQNSLAIVGADEWDERWDAGCASQDGKSAPLWREMPQAPRKAVRFIGAGQAHAAAVRGIFASRVILITVPDDAVTDVAEELARIGAEELRGKVVLHTSGASGPSVLSVLESNGAAVGCMHPLQTLSGVGVPPLEGKIFAIGGDVDAVKTARQIARALGVSPVRMEGNKKILYHAAAAMAAGQVLAVKQAATQLFVLLGVRRREAVRALLSLTRQVLENFERLGPRAAWTGPLSRGDFNVVRAHSDALRKSPKEFVHAYEALNRLAVRALARDAPVLWPNWERLLWNRRQKRRRRG